MPRRGGFAALIGWAGRPPAATELRGRHYGLSRPPWYHFRDKLRPAVATMGTGDCWNVGFLAALESGRISLRSHARDMPMPLFALMLKASRFDRSPSQCSCLKRYTLFPGGVSLMTHRERI